MTARRGPGVAKARSRGERAAVRVETDAAPERTSELRFMRELMLALGSLACLRVWRQNVGQIAVRDRAGEVIRMFDAGPPKGAADLTGITRAGRRVEIEVKARGGALSKEQIAWREMIERWGGVYLLAEWNEDESLEANVERVRADVERALSREG